MISPQLTCFQLPHRYKFGLERHSCYPKAPGAVPLPAPYFSSAAEEATPAPGGGLLGHRYPLATLPRGVSPRARHPKAGLWVYGKSRDLLSQAAGGKPRRRAGARLD